MKCSGFTVVELIVTIMIIAILAVAAAPKLMDRSDFDALRFNDDVFSALRYAHKTAIASRRNVCVTFSATTVTLTTATSQGNNVTCDAALASPTGVRPFVVVANSTTSFSSTPSNFRFDALGRTNIATQMFQVVGMPATITVEQETGYVHP